MKKIGTDKCDAAFALTFFLIILVNIYLPVQFYFLQFLLKNFVEKGYPDWRKFELRVLKS